MDTLPTYAYAAKHSNQSMLGSMDKKAAIVEADIDLTDEPKIQLWGAILGNLASGVLNKPLMDNFTIKTNPIPKNFSVV